MERKTLSYMRVSNDGVDDDDGDDDMNIMYDVEM